MIIIPLDIETVPTQDEAIKADVTAPIREASKAKMEAIDTEIAGLRPPANFKDPEKIAAWEATERPKKEAELRAKRAAIESGVDAAADQAWRDTGLDGAYGHVVVISAAVNDSKPINFYSENWLDDEPVILSRFYNWLLEVVPIEQRANVIFVGHNILGFDLRFIFQRSVIHGIKPPLFVPFHVPSWDHRIFDTQTMWAGQRGNVKLDKICRVLGVARKGSELGFEIDGSKVWDFVRDGRIAEAAIYCGGDVTRVQEIYYRMTFRQQ